MDCVLYVVLLVFNFRFSLLMDYGLLMWFLVGGLILFGTVLACCCVLVICLLI